MKIIFYYYNSTGTLFLSYSDGNGGYTAPSPVFFSLRGGKKPIRRRYGLQNKTIPGIQLY